MKYLNDFIVVICKFIGLFTLVLVLFFFMITPQYKNEYTGSFVDKFERIQNINGPKIVLIGNSNVCYGFRSELIEQELGYEVVNLGLGVGLPPEIFEKIAIDYISEGDILVECPTDFYIGHSIFDVNSAINTWCVIENNLSLWKYVPIKWWPYMIKAFPTYMKRCIERYDSEIGMNENVALGSKFFSEYGDCLYCEEDQRTMDILDNEGVFAYSEVDKEFVDNMTKVRMKVEKKGGKFVIAGYPIIYKGTPPEPSKYDKFNNEMREKLGEIVISDYSDYVYPNTLFYDSHLHLNTEGAILRTNQLIEDLKNSVIR